MKIARTILAIALAAVLTLAGGQAVLAHDFNPAAATIYIDGEETSLGETLHEWNGWHFVEVYAFAEAFGLPVVFDQVYTIEAIWDENNYIYPIGSEGDFYWGEESGVQARRVALLLNQINVGGIGQFGSTSDAESRLVLQFLTLIDRGDFFNLDHLGIFGVAHASNNVHDIIRLIDGWRPNIMSGSYGVSNHFIKDEWIPRRVYELEDERFYWMTETVTRIDHGDFIELMIEDWERSEQDMIENFPFPIVVDGELFIPLEIAVWNLDFELAAENGSFHINTENTRLEVILDGSLMAE